jgi:hypothetical protein
MPLRWTSRYVSFSLQCMRSYGPRNKVRLLFMSMKRLLIYAAWKAFGVEETLFWMLKVHFFEICPRYLRMWKRCGKNIYGCKSAQLDESATKLCSWSLTVRKCSTAFFINRHWAAKLFFFLNKVMVAVNLTVPTFTGRSRIIIRRWCLQQGCETAGWRWNFKDIPLICYLK